MATGDRWSPAQWAITLGPYLTIPGQMVLKTMPTQEVSDYQKVKVAILDHYKVSNGTDPEAEI